MKYTVDASTITFIKCFAVWCLFACVPELLFVFRDGRVSDDRLLVAFFLLLFPLLGTAFLFGRGWIDGVDGMVTSILSGLTIGLAIPVLGGFLLFLLFLVTDALKGVAALIGGFVLGIPSSIGGACAGWIFGRSNK